MAADANIFQQYLKAPKSIMDYQAENDEAETRKNALVQAALTAKNSQQAFDDEQTYRAAHVESGGDMNALQKILISKGLGKRAMEIQASGIDLDHKRAQTSNQNAQAGEHTQKADAGAYELRMKKHEQAIKDIAGFQTPEQAAANLQAHIQSGDVDPTRGQAMLQSIPKDAAQFANWQLSMLRNIMSAKDQVALQVPDANNVNTNRTSVQNNQATNARTAADNAASRQVQMRGQNLTDARTRESNGKAPAGYVWGPAGADGNPTLIAAKGGPADLKIVGALNQDTQALTGSINSFDRLATAANEVLNHPGLKGIAGLRGALPNMPGSDAADAQALLGTLKSQVGFGVLQDMRNNSKTGGALGSVSDAEGKRLEANLAALEKSQSLEQFQSNLKKIIKYSDEAKGRVREAYNLRHGNAPVKVGGAHPPEINDLLNKYGGQ